MRAFLGGLRSSFFSSSAGRWVRPWPAAPGCWPRLRSERGFSCCSLLLPERAFCSTAALARSLAYFVSSVSIRRRDTLTASRSRASAFSLPVLADFAALRNRAFSLESNLIDAFCRRDLLSATRSSVVLLDKALVSVPLAARCLASRALTASEARMALRSRRISLDCDLIVCFWRHDLASAARN